MQQDVKLEYPFLVNPSIISPVVGSRSGYYFFKRVLDVVVAALILMVLSPLLFIIAVLIRLNSPGPAIFAQNRVGARRREANGRIYWQRTIFRCYKFRTMFQDADSSIHKTFVEALINHDQEKISVIQEGDLKLHKMVCDPRITKLGLFLRRTSLDELPQFWNVLLGDMSLVGPRPAIPYEVEMYKPAYHHRLDAKPGLTGLWQVSARSSVDYDEMVCLDIEYVDHQSFWLDLKILFMTPWVVLSEKGAA